MYDATSLKCIMYDNSLCMIRL